MNKLPDKITITWHIDDVKSIAPDLTDDQCREVLQAVERKHDANEAYEKAHIEMENGNFGEPLDPWGGEAEIDSIEEVK